MLSNLHRHSSILYPPILARGSLSGSHEDYPFAAPSSILVVEGRKLLWVADGSFRQLVGKANRDHVKLLRQSMVGVTAETLSDLQRVFGGKLFELKPGDVGVVPPFRVHAAINLDPTISINYTTCSQRQWASSLAATVTMGTEVRWIHACEEAEEAAGSVRYNKEALETAADGLLKKALKRAGRQQVGGYSAPFDKGFVSWIEYRISADLALLVSID